MTKINFNTYEGLRFDGIIDTPLQIILIREVFSKLHEEMGIELDSEIDIKLR
jgi:hypothetical protein